MVSLSKKKKEKKMGDWVRVPANPVCQRCKRTESLVEQTKCANCGFIKHTKQAD
jgi:ribosomal protein L37E